MTTTMNWTRLLNRTRYHSSDAARDELGRSPFHKDHDKVVFSGAFRRLGRKTQVHPLSRNDHVHTRLTHSLEASCVGRSLGMQAGEQLRSELPDWAEPGDLGAIMQAACLAHDIGNPPFGHAGEYAIRDWFRSADERGLLAALAADEKADLLTFEGNAQGFRTVTQIEYNQFEGGMRLTCATLGALMKYPFTSRHAQGTDHPGKYGVCRTELPILRDVADRLGLIAQDEEKWCRHPLAYLTEAADDVCYAVIDLEDGNEMDILQYEQIEPVFQLLSDQQRPLAAEKYSDRRRLAAWRGPVIERCVAEIATAFVRHQPALLAGTLAGDLIDYCHPDVRDGIRAAKQLARDKIFNNHRKTEIEIGAFSTIAVLLEAYSGAIHELHLRGESSFRNRKLLGLISNNRPAAGEPMYISYMRIVDFIAGMTDNFAIGLAHQITGNRYE